MRRPPLGPPAVAPRSPLTSAPRPPPRRFLNDVWVWRADGSWVAVHPSGTPPRPRTLHTATRSGEWIAILGGDTGAPSADGGLRVHLLHVGFGKVDPSEWRWRSMAPRGENPPHRFGHQAALAGSASLLLVGGLRWGQGGLAHGTSTVRRRLPPAAPPLPPPPLPPSPPPHPHPLPRPPADRPRARRLPRPPDARLPRRMRRVRPRPVPLPARPRRHLLRAPLRGRLGRPPVRGRRLPVRPAAHVRRRARRVQVRRRVDGLRLHPGGLRRGVRARPLRRPRPVRLPRGMERSRLLGARAAAAPPPPPAPLCHSPAPPLTPVRPAGAGVPGGVLVAR